MEWKQLDPEAVSLVDGASRRGITLRVVGSGGIRLHCPGPAELMDQLGRPAKDIDFVVPSADRKGMRRYLEERGYVVDRQLLVAMEGRRFSFSHPSTGVDLDVFIERLQFCHTIEVRGRLDRHPLTIALEELLLQKLQIVELTVTDLIDLAVLLATHVVRADGNDTDEVDAGHVAGLLSRDWGFHHTVERNLGRLRTAVVDEVPIRLDIQPRERALEGISRLSAAIDAEPKSLSWRMRGRVGERKQWWEDVDDKEAAY